MHTGGRDRDPEAFEYRDRGAARGNRWTQQYRRQADGDAAPARKRHGYNLSFANDEFGRDNTSQADILVAAIGRAGFVRGEHIKEGATVIDVGINNLSDEKFAHELFDGEELEKRLKTISTRGFTLVGDVNPKEAIGKAANFTPVPGGVGLLTVAMLMKNTVEAARIRRKIQTG